MISYIRKAKTNMSETFGGVYAYKCRLGKYMPSTPLQRTLTLFESISWPPFLFDLHKCHQYG
jgi:hypothetical protein